MGVLCLCLIFGLEFNIINYLWFSGIRLFFYYLGSLIGWLPIFVGIQLGFYFYLYGLEYQYFFCLGYLFISFSLLNYLLLGGIYFFSFALLGQYAFAVMICFIYVLVFHEFSFFSLVIGFPVAFIFYFKFSSLFLRCYFISCLFLIPVVMSIQFRNLPVFEEILLSFALLVFFV